MTKYYKHSKSGESYNGHSIEHNGWQIFNPTEAQLVEAGYELIEEELIPLSFYTPPYEQRVEELIRAKYSLSEELAILRQRDAKPDEWQAYYDYAEGCKRQAKDAIL